MDICNADLTQSIVNAAGSSMLTTKVKKKTVFHGGMMSAEMPRKHVSGHIIQYVVLVCQQTGTHTNACAVMKRATEQAKLAYWREYFFICDEIFNHSKYMENG